MRLSSSWWLLALAPVGAVALLVVLLVGYQQTRRSVGLLTIGEGDAIVDDIQRITRNDPVPMNDQVLARALAAEQDHGVHFIAAVHGDGRMIASTGDRPATFAAALHLPLGEVRVLGESTWVLSRPLPPHGGAPGAGPRGGERREALDGDPSPPPGAPDFPTDPDLALHQFPEPVDPVFFIVEFDPRFAHAVDRTGLITLVVGMVGVATLLVLALLAGKLLGSRDETVRRLEANRHLASLGEISAVLAHEIRNPLAALKGHAQLLVEKLPAGSRELARADQVIEGARRLEELTNSLLDFVRSTTVAREPVAPAECLRAAAGAVAMDRIQVDDHAAPATWSLDPLRLRQVLVNVLDNAVQASPDSGSVTATVRELDGSLIFEIDDHGPGIDPGDEERVFAPFFSRKARGTGLGLTISRKLVALHGGTIDAANRPDGGARFRITIPREKPDKR